MNIKLFIYNPPCFCSLAIIRKNTNNMSDDGWWLEFYVCKVYLFCYIVHGYNALQKVNTVVRIQDAFYN